MDDNLTRKSRSNLSVLLEAFQIFLLLINNSSIPLISMNPNEGESLRKGDESFSLDKEENSIEEKQLLNIST
ncbi:hypothetical protein BpHYR1_016718 [Brachionus plicatilis]|uniref:Uncharacterized protein n=1 Tax=Brachionus plicatilis TaxID=10195 RepID=A0A3M7QK31_BRAPC|nr:hypothetical protein BpHYR1_016718 [Brachionus plicatilis]